MLKRKEILLLRLRLLNTDNLIYSMMQDKSANSLSLFSFVLMCDWI